MAEWAPFLAVAVILTGAVLFFARASQPVLRESVAGGPDLGGSGRPGPADSPGTSESAGKPAAVRDDTDRTSQASRESHVERSYARSQQSHSDEGNPESRQGNPDQAGTESGQSHDDRAGTERRQAHDDGLPTREVADHLAENARRPGAEGDTASETGRNTDSGTGIGELSTGVLLTNVVLTQGLVVVVVLVAGWYFAIPASAFGVGDGVVGPATATVGGVVFGALLWVGNELSTRVADAVGAAYDESVRRMLAPDSTGGWIVLFVAVLPLVALSEEALFRAALIGVPATGYGLSPWLLAVLSSLAFALGHGAQGRVGIVVTGALGLVLAGGYVVSGSLLLVVVAHYVINALEFLVHELHADSRR